MYILCVFEYQKSCILELCELASAWTINPCAGLQINYSAAVLESIVLDGLSIQQSPEIEHWHNKQYL